MDNKEIYEQIKDMIEDIKDIKNKIEEHEKQIEDIENFDIETVLEKKMDKKAIYDFYNTLALIALQNNNQDVYDYNFDKLTSLLTLEEITELAIEDDLEKSFYQ